VKVIGEEQSVRTSEPQDSNSLTDKASEQGVPPVTKFSLLPITLLTLCLGFTSLVRAEDPKPSRLGIVADKPLQAPFVAIDDGFMVPYTVKLPGCDESFRMIPIPGGQFQLGSPAGEPGRNENEGPQVAVTVSPFWMGEHEVTWGEYHQYMNLYVLFTELHFRKIRPVSDDNKADAITAPSEIYEPAFHYEHGDDPNQPAVTMTQYAAKQYSKWISLMYGQQYRLPTEAEWEYACRANSKTAYHFGNDPSQLVNYGWYEANCKRDLIYSKWGARIVGTKKPNAWGLYDMHGNVAEWVLDSKRENGYSKLVNKQNLNPLDTFQPPKDEWNRVVRGGSWESDATACRSAAKMTSESIWQETDPEFPKSPWWHSDDPTRGVGFRLMRPLHELPRNKMVRFWEPDVEQTIDAIEETSKVGKGRYGIVDPKLPEIIKKFQEEE